MAAASALVIAVLLGGCASSTGWIEPLPRTVSVPLPPSHKPTPPPPTVPDRRTLTERIDSINQEVDALRERLRPPPLGASKE